MRFIHSTKIFGFNTVNSYYNMGYSPLFDNKQPDIDLRRKLRRKQTKAEQVLWYDIRNQKLGVIFRRQYQIQFYFADFYCHTLKLIVELDGTAHDNEEQQKHDQKRQRWLESMGYTVIRFRNEAILFDRGPVLDTLRQFIDSKTNI